MRITVLTLAAALLVGGCPTASGPADTSDPQTPNPDTLHIFHNNSGPMCLAALDWLADTQATYPALTVEEHLTYEDGETELLRQYESLYAGSQGVSASFAYLPIIFFRGQAFSGFDDDVGQTLEGLLAALASAP